MKKRTIDILNAILLALSIVVAWMLSMRAENAWAAIALYWGVTVGKNLLILFEQGDKKAAASEEWDGKIRVQLDEWAYLPKRAHAMDAGLDLRAREAAIVPAGGSAIFSTGVHIEIPDGFAGLLVSKSGLNVKHDVTSTGLIDAGYTGDITVKLYNRGDSDYIVSEGDKISQLVLIPCMTAETKQVKRIYGGARGDSGFGSSGK